MVSQSGAMAGMIYEMARAAGFGLNYWVSTGNEADVQAAEILAEVVEDPETRVACTYLEDVKDAGRLRDALARAHRRGVPVFVLKSGRSAVGRRAASSHTGALAGEDAVYDAVFADWGAIRCADPAELLALPQAFLRYRDAGTRVAILAWTWAWCPPSSRRRQPRSCARPCRTSRRPPIRSTSPRRC